VSNSLSAGPVLSEGIVADDFVSLKLLAAELGLDRSNMRKYALKVGVKPHTRRTPDSGGQLTLAVSAAEAEFIRTKRRDQGFLESSKPVSAEVGVFYIIQLIPDLDPSRLKFGFADDIRARFDQHRTSAPTAKVVKTWPCRRAWEGTVIDCLAAAGCKLILNEVYECDTVAAVSGRADALFALLPPPDMRPALSDRSPLRSSSQSSA
jgi:hypothetical protein